jgi:hypothetical protein
MKSNHMYSRHLLIIVHHEAKWHSAMSRTTQCHHGVKQQSATSKQKECFCSFSYVKPACHNSVKFYPGIVRTGHSVVTANGTVPLARR